MSSCWRFGGGVVDFLEEPPVEHGDGLADERLALFGILRRGYERIQCSIKLFWGDVRGS